MKRISFFLLCILFVETAFSQDRNEMNTANMSRAMEAYSNNDVGEMRRYLEAEIAANPKNGYAYSWLALLYNYYEEHGYAISAAEKALQYIPKKDKEYVVFAYTSRANAYTKLEDFKKALADYNAAIKADPEKAANYQGRGDFYFEREEYELAEKDYQKYISMEPSDPLGYMGIGRNYKQQGKYEEAIRWFDKALQLRGSDYSKGYSFRGECYIALGRFDEAASDIVTALAIDSDNKAYYHMQQLADSSYRTIVSRLKVQADKEPNNSEWYYYLGVVSQRTKRYDKAIEYYSKGEKIDGNDVFYHRIAECYETKGAFEKALYYINIAIEKDSTDLDYRTTRIGINYELNNISSIFSDLDFCISQNTPYQYWYYYRRGWYKDLTGDTEGAIEDYTSSITLNQDYAYVYMSRGELLMKEGETSAARKDFQKCIAIDTADMEHMDCAFYAYHALGDNESAKRLLDTLLAHDDNTGNLYDAACLYSRMGEVNTAINYLRKAFEKGYRRFTHLDRDDDMDNIRNEEEYKRLVSQYKEIWKREVGSDEQSVASLVEKSVEILFKRRNGVTEVNCSINGLPLYFIFDTGAGDVTISSVEAAFMFKNGYLSEKDVIGRKNYRTASGDIVEGTLINLSTIEIGELSLSNVRASVVKGQNAPLLLGQSVLSRLGKVEIDNANQKIKITYQESK